MNNQKEIVRNFLNKQIAQKFSEAKKSMKNPNCDHDLCKNPNGEIRVLPTGSSNALLCFTCFLHELQWRRERNLELPEDCQFDLPTWRSLEVYNPGK